MWRVLRESRLMAYLGLFTSFGTLLCCAIPAALVFLGFGAVLAGVLGELPQLIWLSENKVWVFGTSFFLLGLSFMSQKASEARECPIDQRETCGSLRSRSGKVLIITAILNLIGAFSAFVLPRLM